MILSYDANPGRMEFSERTRREFIGLLATIAVCPQWVLGQTAKKRPLVAWLGFAPKGTSLTEGYLDQFLTGMRELGETRFLIRT
jgi:hypothetical protein